MSQLSFFFRRSIALAACGLLIFVGRAEADSSVDDVFAIGAPAGSVVAIQPDALQDSGSAGAVQQVGWWHHDPCPQACDQPTAGEYSLPGNPSSPVIIENGPCPPIAGPAVACPPQGGPLLAAPYGAAPYPGLPAPADPFFPYAKSGPLQDARFTTTWLPRNGGGGISFIDADANATLAVPVPMPGDKSFLLVTPDAETHFVDGSDADPLPHQLYVASMLIQFLGQLPDNILFDVGAAPTWATDTKDTSQNWRSAVYVAFGYRFSQTFAFGLGVGWLDRRDIGLIPIGGVIWVPNPDLRFELYPPKPRIEYCICHAAGHDDWLYAGGELGGGQWAFEHPDGTHDIVSYYDWRALLGIERRSTCGGLGGMVELGYVFGRHLEFASNIPTEDPPNTFLVRAGVIY